MTKVERAVECFEEGFNCSQAIFYTYGQEYGIPPEHAFKIASGFGGGMRIDGTCGAVTGAFMAIGLKFGRGKDKPYDKIIRFAEMFCQRNKSTSCQTLIGCDIRTKQGMDKATNEGLFRTICSQLVKDSAEILEIILKDDSSN